jgi:hypothetical protein
MARRKNQVTAIADETPVAEEQEQVVAETVEEQAPQAPEGETEEQVEEGPSDHCRMCGRLLTAEASVIRGLGPVCAGHVARELKALGMTLTASEGEEGYAPEEQVAEIVDKLKTAGTRVEPDDFNPDENEHPAFPERGPMAFVKITGFLPEDKSVGHFLKLIGGDRALLEPAEWYWTPVYVGRQRYLPAEAANHLDEVNDRRVRVAKVEEADEAPTDEAETPATAEDTGDAAA